MSESKEIMCEPEKIKPLNVPKEQPINVQNRGPRDTSKEQVTEKGRKSTVEEAFFAHAVFPEPEAAFSYIPPPVSSVLKDCDVVLDTNVLLLPYESGASSLKQIKIVYQKLRKENRLFVPAQVAREFARHRPRHIADLYKAISDCSSRVVVPVKLAYPLLEGIDEYNELTTAVSKLEEAKKVYLKAVAKLLERIKEWQWNDPVSAAYQKLFVKTCICEPVLDKESVLQDKERRYASKTPPGYKDGGKDDGGIGDYLIWLTILDIGKSRNKPLIFVTGEEKPDWQHRSGSQGLLPRYELVDEYRRVSGNKSFFIMSLSDLLELLDAPKSTVNEIRSEEAKKRDQLAEILVACPYCGTQAECSIDVCIGASSTPVCPSCKKRFHVNRTSEGIIVNPLGGRSRRRPVLIDEPLNERWSEIARHIAESQDCNNQLFSSSTGIPDLDFNAYDSFKCAQCGRNFRATDERIKKTGVICNDCLGYQMEDYFG